ncbi:MAG: hypothetical protein NTY68_01690, partial [Candidatus Micrarchaeota archaeon]|nr:hypothetical protein [Candidatus Micrarchaeota archaeon]
AEAPTAKASDIIQPKKKEPAIQQDISPTPKLREMPKEKDVAHAASPIERLAQKEKGKVS